MDINEIRGILNELSDEKYKKNVIRLGIPKDKALGVRTGDIRKLARKIRTDHKLAWELWQSGVHEEKILAVLLFDKKDITYQEIESLMHDVNSWDLCDHICKNLIIKTSFAADIIKSWSKQSSLYFRRAAFVLMTAEIVKKREKIEPEQVELYIEKIKECANDTRPHVRKAISWALREIGKINYDYQEKAILVAYELIEEGKASAWVGKNALKELETLVKVDERGRLLSSDSKMGRKYK
ncbi:DNA alkylation repair protein [Iocasia frigidifontis]|uniref:DNA alkylation repair protein n=1 Tax=Iocasia fonsfrigidae TaxID=2682810 RepID=A0A8A7K8I9_9FIRM|nr:DNA alkylation repair protein [Iocasia fonsfrigidae]QTL97520.1 DNA alkylation repair protein [Iocasia fonsfrigidae]